LTAANGKDGVAIALQKKPDIIVCDIMMPELDGYGVIHLLQKHEETQNIPFIFITAKAERTEMRKGMELGADDYITKPFTGSELLNAVEGRLKKAANILTALPSQLAALAGIADHPDTRNLEEIIGNGQDSREYFKKQSIYQKGQNAFRLYYITSGKVKAFKTNDDGKQLITNIYRAGDFFGYTALLEGTPHHESAEALEACEIASIPRQAFEELMNNNPGIMSQFIKLLAGNVQEKESQLLCLAYNSLRKKVADALLLLQSKYKAQYKDSTAMIQMSRDNLAAIAGTAKESLIRTLGDFRNEGLIEMHGTDIMILDEKKLRQMLN
jgi:CRP-like cAMP-binding protein